MKKLIFLSYILIIVFIFTGCWDFKQIDNYYIITGLGIDKNEDGEFVVTTRIPVPITGLQTSSTFTTEGRVISRRGNTILNALQKMGNELKKEIFLGHLQVVIISRDIAKSDIERVIDNFSRNPHVQRKLYLLISDKEAKDIIGSVNPLDVAPIPDLANMFDINKTNNFIPVTLDEFIFKYRGIGYAPILPLAKVNNNIIEVNGMGVFHDDNFIGELNGEETRALSLLISPDFTSEYYTVPGGDVNNDEKTYITIRTSNKSSKIKVSLEDSHIKAFLTIKLNARISEYSNIKRNQDIQDLYRMVEKQLERQLLKDLESLIKKSKDYNSDIFGIGKYVRANHMKYWDKINWEEEYANTEFKINIIVNLRSASSTKISID
ncbi:Ger(x)C family spore germination protein [Sporosalibacterium faouarense]|uniref:Ger(x)C family spore germination protein n=1 Tax=Sporosalibacterium faouarense TaxID=516123 RepID=UPI00192C12F2|nr:Ger(x)C family spore germination protein [Sporosalibacterium faouarense]